MSVELAKSLKLSYDPRDTKEATANAAPTIEAFLGQFSETEQAGILSRLLSGEALIAKHGEQDGRQTAANRLALMMKPIGEIAFDLSDVEVHDVVIPGHSTTTDVELTKQVNQRP